MSTPIVASSFDAKKLNASKIKKLDNGSSQVYLNYTGGPANGRVRVQAPRMRVPYDAGDYQDNKKFKVQFSFGGKDENPRLQAFYNMIEAIDNYVIDQGVKNAGEWFKKPGASREIVSEFFTPSIKFSKDKQGNVRTEYPPTFAAALKQKSGAWDLELYDGDNHLLDGIDPCDELRRGAEVIPILDVTGIWVADKKFGITWKLHQGRIMQRAESSGSGAFVGVEDEEDGVPAPSKPRALVGGGGAVVTPAGGAGMVSEEDEDDVLSAVTAAPAPAPAPVAVAPLEDDDEDDSDNLLPTPAVPAPKPAAKPAAATTKPKATTAAATGAPTKKPVATKAK